MNGVIEINNKSPILIERLMYIEEFIRLTTPERLRKTAEIIYIDFIDKVVLWRE